MSKSVRLAVYTEDLLSLILRELPLAEVGPGEGFFLEFGSGDGARSEELLARTSASIACIEPDPVWRACYPSTRPPLRDMQFVKPAGAAGAYSICGLARYANDDEILRELAQKVKPGGRIFLMMPGRPSGTAPLSGVRSYTPEQLHALGLSAGLSVVQEGWFDCVGYWFARMVWAMRRVGVRMPELNRASWLANYLYPRLEPLLQRRRSPGVMCWVAYQVPKE